MSLVNTILLVVGGAIVMLLYGASLAFVSYTVVDRLTR